jgi:hypothetical protein
VPNLTIENLAKDSLANTVYLSNQTRRYSQYLVDLEKKLVDFSQFAAAEAQNKSLKNFLDVYRLEYALHYKIVGSSDKSTRYLKEITSKIPFKTKLLLLMPRTILRFLLTFKQQLKKRGIDFSVYH